MYKMAYFEVEIFGSCGVCLTNESIEEDLTIIVSENMN